MARRVGTSDDGTSDDGTGRARLSRLRRAQLLEKAAMAHAFSDDFPPVPEPNEVVDFGSRIVGMSAETSSGSSEDGAGEESESKSWLDLDSASWLLSGDSLPTGFPEGSIPREDAFDTLLSQERVTHPVTSHWKMGFAANGRPFFVDRATSMTTWVDPRPGAALDIVAMPAGAALDRSLLTVDAMDATPAVAQADQRPVPITDFPPQAALQHKGGLCPFCGEHHKRFGRFWRKFGYDGPAYCYRCSCVFRSHMLTCKMASDKCTREAPCDRCSKMLVHFSKPHAEMFAAMDESQPLSRGTYSRPGASSGDGPEVACPLCSRTNHGGLGTFWRKFGYDGPPYCTLCSASVRNHIIRRRGTRTKCSREDPCSDCERVLKHFPGDRAAVYKRMDEEQPESKQRTAQPPEPQAPLATYCTSSKRQHFTTDLPTPDVAGSVPIKRRRSSVAAAFALGLIGLMMLVTGTRKPQTSESSPRGPGDISGTVDPSTMPPPVPPHAPNRANAAVRDHHAPRSACDDATLPTLEDCEAEPRFSRFFCGAFLPDHMLASCVGGPGDTCEYVCQDGYVPSGIRRCENVTDLPNQQTTQTFHHFHGGSCIPGSQPPPPLPTPWQAGAKNATGDASDSQFVYPAVVQTATDAFGQYVTYQLALSFMPSVVRNVYAIFGTPANPMVIPAAFHAPDPFGGADIGGSNPLLWKNNPALRFDSWLTVGAVQWDDGQTNDHLSSAGIDFDSWTATQDLIVSNGALFWIEPDVGCPQDPTLVAQFSSKSRWKAVINARGKLAEGQHAENTPGDHFYDGHYKDEWEVEGLVFTSDMAIVTTQPSWAGKRGGNR